MTSFFAHFVLFRRRTGQEIDVDVANTVIQAYIDILQGSQMDQLVAVYAAELREGTAEDSYAAFLRGKLRLMTGTWPLDPDGLVLESGMSRHASREERRVALLRAQQHGLNIRMIANAVIKPVVGIIQVSIWAQRLACGANPGVSIVQVEKHWLATALQTENSIVQGRLRGDYSFASMVDFCGGNISGRLECGEYSTMLDVQ